MFGKNNCRGNCLQEKLDHDCARADAKTPAAANESFPSPTPASEKLFDFCQPRGSAFFSVNLGREWLKA